MTKNMRTGAQTLMDALENQGVEYIFGYPGGANIPIFDALLDSSIELILSRHEQGATHMADGYARATGKAGVVLVTSGPGATNAITGILTAHMDSVPMIILCGQTISPNLGLDAFQEADVSGISYPVVKHSYLVKNPNDIPRVIKESFYLSETGRPGPVLLDIPKDVSSTLIKPDHTIEKYLPGYSFPAEGSQELIQKVADALEKAKRPLLLVGHGAVISDASKALKSLIEKNHIPMVNTLLGKGAYPETSEYNLGMLGMHGTAYANKAVMNCDLIMSIGSRWDDRIVGKLETFCENAFKIHIDIDPSEDSKMIQPDVFVLGDAKHVLEELNTVIQKGDTKDWLKQTKKWRKQFPLTYKKQGGLKAEFILDELNRITKSKAIITTDVGQHQMWAAQYCLTDERNHWITSGGAGTMGFGFPAALGAQLAHPKALVVAVVGDGGFQMTLAELATAVNHKLPVKILIMDNKYLGMVRQWQDIFFENRMSGVDMVGNPNFVKLGEAYGCKGFKIKRNADVVKVLKEALLYNDGPCIIHAEISKTDNVFPMVPSGAPYDQMMLERPKGEVEKPTGST